MRKSKINLMLFGIILIFLIGCANTKFEGKETIELIEPAYKNMTTDELNEQLKNKDFVLIDVHIPEQEHIKGTDASLPYDEIENQLEKLPSEKDAKIVLYCRTGRMSEIAAEKLAEKGYTNVYNVVGGKVEWDGKGYK